MQRAIQEHSYAALCIVQCNKAKIEIYCPGSVSALTSGSLLYPFIGCCDVINSVRNPMFQPAAEQSRDLAARKK
jgi:hypothetical protein